MSATVPTGHHEIVCPICGRRVGGCRCIEGHNRRVLDAQPCPDCRAKPASRLCAVVDCGKRDVVDPAAKGSWPTYAPMPLCAEHLVAVAAVSQADGDPGEPA